MEKEEYLSEEKYQKTKNKISKIAILVLVVGILLGGGLITFGIMKSNSSDTNITQTRTESDVQNEINTLNEELIPLKAQKTKEFQENGFTEEYYRLDNEIQTKQSQITDLETELWKMQSGFNSASDFISKGKYIPLYMFGAFIIIASGMIAFSIYMFSKRREITAFTTQQIMPVAQEGIEKMAPTIGKVGKELAEEMAPVYGKIAKEISNGIKEGQKEE